MHDNSKGTSRLAEGGAHIGKTKWWIYLNLHPIYEVKSVVAKFTRQKRRQNKKPWANTYDEPFCVWAARTLWRWSLSRLPGGRGEGQVISACGCPSALQDDTPRESCLGDQSFLNEYFQPFSKFAVYIGQEEVSIFPLGPFRLFFQLDLGHLFVP